jgi:hypothetical protein
VLLVARVSAYARWLHWGFISSAAEQQTELTYDYDFLP